MADHNLIYQLEELAANAWPARVTQTVDGWRLRYTDGVTRRANSVWPNLHSPNVPQNPSTLEQRIDTVERFYALRNLPARFQICPAAQPDGLETYLCEHGYQGDATTNVQTTTIAQILGKIEPDPGINVTIDQHITEAWFESYCQSEALGAHAATVRRGILERIAPSAGFAYITQKADEPAALGLGVVERGWLGIFCMTTKPAFRRRGLASSLLRGLAEWASTHNGHSAYLQVMVENEAAQRLYGRVGFETVYQYHYRERNLPISYDQ